MSPVIRLRENEPPDNEPEDSTARRRKELHRPGVFWDVRSSVWSPPTDIYETAENVVVKVEIAGMDDDDFEVFFENNVLTISGDRRDLNERRAYHQMEIKIGKFEISVGLPELFNADDAQAEYKNGFLIITFPKSQLAGDSTTDAPPPDVDKEKKPKGK